MNVRLPLLTLRAIRSVGVEVPMTHALGTSRGTITKAPLLLIDLETEEESPAVPISGAISRGDARHCDNP